MKLSYQSLNTVVIIGALFFALSKKIPNWQLLVLSRARYTRPRCEICSQLTIRYQNDVKRRGTGVFIVNFEHISHLVLVPLLLTLNMFDLPG